MGGFYDELKSEHEEKNSLYRLRKSLGEEDFKDFMKDVQAELSDRSVFTRLKSEMSKDDYADLLKVLADKTISCGAIQRALTKRGLQVSTSAINQNRRLLGKKK